MPRLSSPPASPLRLLVVADDVIARAGLRALAEAAGFTVSDERAADEAVADAQDADALLWDVGRAAAIEPLRAASALLPVVAVLWSEEQARAVLAAGVRAILLRDTLEERLVPAVQAAAAGLIVVAPAAAEALVAPRAGTGEELVEALTPRESEVLQRMAEGLTNRRIGERLGISEHTVKFHVNAVLGKLGARTRGEAIAQAARLGLLLL